MGVESRRHNKDSFLAMVRKVSKITSKYQVTVPKAIAERYRIRPGDEIEWLPAGDAIRVVPGRAHSPIGDVALRLKLFDQATQRHRARARPRQTSPDRGWSREDLYRRGRSR